MSHFRFSLLGLGGLVALVAVGCAALAYASLILAGVVWLVTFLILSLGAIGAILRSQPARSFWIGFAMLGWLYVLTLGGMLTGVGSSISMNTLLEKVAMQMPKSLVTVEFDVADNSGMGGMMGGMPGGGGMMPGAAEGMVDGGMMGGAMPAAVGVTRSSYQTVDSEYVAAFTRTGQGILTLLLACLGGLAGRWFHGRNGVSALRATYEDQSTRLDKEPS